MIQPADGDLSNAPVQESTEIRIFIFRVVEARDNFLTTNGGALYHMACKAKGYGAHGIK